MVFCPVAIFLGNTFGLDVRLPLQSIPHDITLGIQAWNALNCFRSCIENRAQICSVSGSLSKTCSLQCGIPQGTILGPLLFLTYQIGKLTFWITKLLNWLVSNNLCRWYASYLRAYADKDVNIIQSCLNEDLLNISKWLIANKITINMTKNRLEAKAKHPNYYLPCTERQRYSHTPRINVKISGCTHLCKLYMGQSSKGWLKKLPLVLQLSKESDNLFPQQHSILSTKPWFSRILAHSRCGLQAAQ